MNKASKCTVQYTHLHESRHFRLTFKNTIPPNLLKRRYQVAKHAQKQLRQRGRAAPWQVGRINLQRLQTRGEV